MKYTKGIIDDEEYRIGKNEIDEEILELEAELFKWDEKMSNIEKNINKSVELVTNIGNYWKSGGVDLKQKLQKLVYPLGVLVDTQNRECRTKKTNLFFTLTNRLSKEYKGHKKRLKGNKSDESSLVAGTGLEPATYGL